MKMLDDIIDGAADDNVSLTALLRKCLVIADTLKNDNLKSWVLSELNGYKEKEEIPPYRIIPTQAVGLFLGPHGSHLNDQPLNPAVLNEVHREWATTSYLAHQMASYEATIEASKRDLVAPWPAEIVAQYQRKFLHDSNMVLNRAHQRIPIHAVVGMVDTVRNKLLQFALELRNEIGSEEPTPQNPPPIVVDRQVTTIIYGGTNVFGGGNLTQTIHNTVIQGDFSSLANALTAIGIPAELHDDLHEALEEDKSTEAAQTIGTKTKAWIAKALKATGRGALKLGEKAAEEAIKQAIDYYLKGHPF